MNDNVKTAAYEIKSLGLNKTFQLQLVLLLNKFQPLNVRLNENLALL